MALRKRTLRRMSSTSRKLARLIARQESIARRLKNIGGKGGGSLPKNPKT
ncbi:hypothetical protein KKF61_06935 [Patescibacteria group bacterium]|nr:hypothetical protein [Patescibacteria group bacterium]